MFRNHLAILTATIALAAAGSANAAILTSYTPLGDQGTLRTTTYTPLAIANGTVSSPYGTPPNPTITTIASGWKLTYTLSPAFFAAANAGGGGKTSEMAGKLEFIVAFDTAINFTLNLNEGGTYTKSGSGVVGVFGGAVVSEAVNAVPTESHGNSSLAAVFGAGTWTAGAQVGGFSNNFTAYKVTIDNDLLAEALVNPGDAIITKTTFSINITTDGSGGPNTPEPASLGVLALGGMGLLVRRRRA